MAVMTYKCPNCGGRLEFDSSLQEMKCPYCDSTFEVSTLKDQDSVLDTPAPPAASAVTPATDAAPSAPTTDAAAGADVVGAAAPTPAAGAGAAAAAAAAAEATATGTTAAGTPDAAPAAAAPTPAADWQLPTEQWDASETADMRVYTCSTCAGQIVGDATLGATSCPYCGNPVIMTGQ
ncbi:MAG: hypothetical protein FWF30_03485, partial [Coriobacteriia bacterium]|nr:hypothetical protein [Coriobacteriia bacterium]